MELKSEGMSTTIYEISQLFFRNFLKVTNSFVDAEIISMERVSMSGPTFTELEVDDDVSLESQIFQSSEDSLESREDLDSMEYFEDIVESKEIAEISLESFEIDEDEMSWNFTESSYSIILSDCGEEPCSFVFAGSALSDQAVGKYLHSLLLHFSQSLSARWDTATHRLRHLHGVLLPPGEVHEVPALSLPGW